MWAGNDWADSRSKAARLDLVPPRFRRPVLSERLADPLGAPNYQAMVSALGGLGSIVSAWRASLPKFVVAAQARIPREHARHQLLANGGRAPYVCAFCGVCAPSALRWAVLRHSACRGPISLRASTTHTLRFSAAGSVTWCAKCGAWATRKPRRLLRPCCGASPSAGMAEALRRLQRGLHPLAKLRGARDVCGDAQPVAAGRAVAGNVGPAPVGAGSCPLRPYGAAGTLPLAHLHRGPKLLPPPPVVAPNVAVFGSSSYDASRIRALTCDAFAPFHWAQHGAGVRCPSAPSLGSVVEVPVSVPSVRAVVRACRGRSLVRSRASVDPLGAGPPRASASGLRQTRRPALGLPSGVRGVGK